VPNIRLIDEDENQIGIMTTEEAKKMAQEKEMDLVEVSPLAQPPVCKMMDYGKYLYRQNKIDRKQKSSQKKTEVKGIRFSLRISDHDLEIKATQARKFLADRDSVKVQLVFKGREASHQDLAEKKLSNFAQLLADVSKVDSPPKRHGMSMNMILNPFQNTPEPSNNQN